MSESRQTLRRLSPAKRIVDQVYEVVRERILDRTFRPQQKLSAEELAEQLGVSRSPVHEALVMLAGEGLVNIVPRRGTYVTSVSIEELLETMDVRRALELLACEKAVDYVTEGDLKELYRLTTLMRESADKVQGAEEHDESNLEFHRRFVALSRNRRLIDLYQVLDAHLQIAHAHHSKSTWRERVVQEEAEHIAILQALEKRDEEALKGAIQFHLERSSASLAADAQPGAS